MTQHQAGTQTPALKGIENLRGDKLKTIGCSQPRQIQTPVDWLEKKSKTALR